MAKTTKDKKKKNKAPVDPNAPKKPTCAYFFFQIVRRPQVKAERSNLSNTEVVIQLGKDWNILTDMQKLPFEKLAEADKVRYEREMDTYYKEHFDNESKVDENADGEGGANKNKKRAKPRKGGRKTKDEKIKPKRVKKEKKIKEANENQDDNKIKEEAEVDDIVVQIDKTGEKKDSSTIYKKRITKPKKEKSLINTSTAVIDTPKVENVDKNEIEINDFEEVNQLNETINN